MARLTIEKLRRHNRNHKLNHGTVYQQKVAGLELLERQYEKTGEKWIGRIIRKVLGCSRTYRCNSKYCPFCSNPRSVKAKRKIDDGSYQMPYKHPATVNKKSNNYRERAGQRQMGPFHGVPTAMTHCLTVNLALVACLLHWSPVWSCQEPRGDSAEQTRGGTMRTGVDFDVSDEQRRRLEAIAGGGNSKVKHARRARIVLLTDDGLGTMAVMAETGSAKATVWRWQERFMREGVDLSIPHT